MTGDPFLDLAEAEIIKQQAVIQQLRAEVRKLRWIVLLLFIGGTVTWLAGLLS
jgi:hypothetical protein